MKLRDIYILCKNNVKEIESIQTSTNIISKIDGMIINAKDKFDEQKMEMVYYIAGIGKAISAVKRLKEVKCLDAIASTFFEKIPFYNGRILQLNEREFTAFSSAKTELLGYINCIISLYEMMGLEEKEIIGLDIKLPVTSDFSDFRKYIDDLEFIFTKCPFFKHERERLIFKNVDVGSTWLTLAVIGTTVTTGSILINNIAAFIDKCMILSIRHKTIQKQKFDLERDESLANDKETIIKYLNHTYKKAVDIAIKDLEESTNYKLVDGDERGRTEQAFERLEKLIDKGLQIYSTIDSPEETKALFEPLEMKYLEINKQLELLDKKDDEPNND